jgi:branched-chain amino acid transport system substrate-binding protein
MAARKQCCKPASYNKREEAIMLSRRRFGLLASAAIGSHAVAASAQSRRKVKLGGLATLDGPLAELGKDGFRGLELALAELGSGTEGVEIELSRGSSDSKPDVALAAARRLIEQDKVDILIGPLSGSEGIRIKDYAKTVPRVTFVNGSSAAVETTLVSPAPNFYRFNPDGAQLTAGLGSYIRKAKGWNKIAIVAEDYSFPYAQILGLMGTFCATGGRVAHKFFVPLGTKDYSSVIAQLPDKSEVDAVFIVLGGADAVNFLTQYTQSGGDLPIIGGSLTVDQTVLDSKGPVRAHLPGVLASGPLSDNDDSPAWRNFVATYRKRYPDGLPSPSYPCLEYYISTKAVLLGLKAVNGDLSDDQVRYRAALDKLSFETPTGPISLNQNRQATATVFINEVVEKGGRLTTTPVQRFEAVDQFLGLGEPAYKQLGSPSRDNPSCA